VKENTYLPSKIREGKEKRRDPVKEKSY